MTIAEFVKQTKDMVPDHFKLFILSTDKNDNNTSCRKQMIWAENAKEALSVLTENGRITPKIPCYYLYEVIKFDGDIIIESVVNTLENHLIKPHEN